MTQMGRILISAFEPFGAEPSNSSLDTLSALPSHIAGVEIVKKVLPVEFKRAPMLLKQAVEELAPDALISLGQAGGRAEVSLERSAVNFAKAKNADNADFRPEGLLIIPEAPDLYFSPLPVDALADVVRSGGVACKVSDSAGLYVCNALFFSMLHYFRSLPVGFVHLPYTSEQAARKPAATPSMSVADMAKAVELLVSSI